MTDDLKERLRNPLGPEVDGYRLTYPWVIDLCEEAFNRITDLEVRLAAAETERDGFRRNLRESFVSPGDAAPPASEPSEYEKKVAQMKEDFPNGI